METLVRHMVEPIVSKPDAVSVQVIEGDNVRMVELVVHPDDKDIFTDDSGKTLRAMRTIVNAAAGRNKATVDLVDEHGSAEEE